MNKITRINLSYLKKCDQVWNDMPKNEKGRLCSKCSNTIIDFRNSTNAEIAQTHLFSKHRVCGLYNKKQIKKPSAKTKKQQLNIWNSVYLGLFSFLSFNSYGQDKKEQIKTEQTEKKYGSINHIIKEVNTKKRSIVKDSIIISGKLIDEELNDPMPGGNVLIKGTKIGTSSDFDGNYRLNITEELDSLKKITLVYSFIGFKTVEKLIEFDTVKENRVINITFVDSGELSEFFVTYRSPIHKRIWNRTKNLFRKKR